MRRLPESWYSILAPGIVYSGYQRAIGADKFRRRFLHRQDLFKAGSVVLDIGCGPGEASTWVGPANYVGYEPNRSYVDRAKRERGALGDFRRGDARDVPADFTCDVVLLMAVISSVPDEVADYSLEVAARSLRPGGTLLAHDGVYAPGQSAASKFMLNIERNAHIRQLSSYQHLLSSYFPNASFKVRTDSYRIPYSMVVVEAMKA